MKKIALSTYGVESLSRTEEAHWVLRGACTYSKVKNERTLSEEVTYFFREKEAEEEEAAAEDLTIEFLSYWSCGEDLSAEDALQKTGLPIGEML